MIVSFTVVKYRPLFVPFALLAMALHRVPLAFNKKCSFWKLLGTGKNGTFDLNPDWQQWGLLAVWDAQEDFENSRFIHSWWNLLTKETWTVLMEPLSSHGMWDGIQPFKASGQPDNFTGAIGVLTRATIRFSKLKSFWSNVQPVAELMSKSPGYITSVGVGEAPVFKQATFSVWESVEKMKAFAYGSKEHADVIRKTREGNWYSEELFARFRIISTTGTINGTNPADTI